ncbi:hypothetical protein Tco_0834935, partial [Tanacetum coccineum]
VVIDVVDASKYLQHCVETTVLLATIGANATVVAAGLFHTRQSLCSYCLWHLYRRGNTTDRGIAAAGRSVVVVGPVGLRHLRHSIPDKPMNESKPKFGNKDHVDLKTKL